MSINHETAKKIRQRFLDNENYSNLNEYQETEIKIANEHLESKGILDEAKQRFLWLKSSILLENTILQYTAGKKVQDISQSISEIIKTHKQQVEIEHELCQKNKNIAATLEITQLEAYSRIIWLFALCFLTLNSTHIPTIISWLNFEKEFNRGRDGLLESIIQKLTGEAILTDRVLLHPVPYKPLAKATVVPQEERPAFVHEFLKEWYKGMKPCYWYGTHTDKQGSSYFGYWAFEAALVTVLWDIDDTEYRDHLVYPKDLVDWYRANTKASDPQDTLSCNANAPCPKTGWWFTPAKIGSRAFFKQGDIMPDFPGSDYGKVIWQWDMDQSHPAL